MRGELACVEFIAPFSLFPVSYVALQFLFQASGQISATDFVRVTSTEWYAFFSFKSQGHTYTITNIDA